MAPGSATQESMAPAPATQTPTLAKNPRGSVVRAIGTTWKHMLLPGIALTTCYQVSALTTLPGGAPNGWDGMGQF